MRIRWLINSDYERLVGWWKWFRFPAPPQHALPNNGTYGVMVSEGDVDICAGYLYLTNSSMAWVEFVISNPDVKDRETRKVALRTLIDSLCAIAEAAGYSVAYVSLKNESLINRYEECGFTKGSENCIELIKILK